MPPAATNAAAKLGLGAFGRPPAGGRRLSQAEAFATVALAADAGVRLIDTSARWPGSERALGAVLPTHPGFRLVTKTAAIEQGLAAVERRARASLENLGVARGHVLLAHRAEDLLGPDGPGLWDRMRRLKDEGIYEAIGFCACVCDDPVGLARRLRPDVVQLPASLLDQRLIRNGALQEMAALGVRVHLRSVFLRGLLFLPGDRLPEGLAAMAPGLSRIRRILAEAGGDPLRAALSFALGRPEAEAVIVGVSSPAEFRAVLAGAAAPAPALDWSALAMDSPCVAGQRRCAAA